MTVKDFLATNIKLLTSHGVGTARLDCLVLLEDILNKDRTHLLAHPELELTPYQQHTLEQLIERRSQHEPLAYLRKKTEFYGHEFYIDHRVLEPRPESEALIDQLLRLAPTPPLTIIDVGTGSGALAITAKIHLPNASVIGIDIDPQCLEVAALNAQSLKVDVTFLHGNLLDPLASHLHNPYILVCNLPYVPDTFTINPAAMREPHLAIFGGPDGLDIYRELFTQLQILPYQPSFVLTEALPPQHGELTRIAAIAHYMLRDTDDFIQTFSPTEN